jgi:hypothetical protein
MGNFGFWMPDLALVLTMIGSDLEKGSRQQAAGNLGFSFVTPCGREVVSTSSTHRASLMRSLR